jgi:hypothetical protein
MRIDLRVSRIVMCMFVLFGLIASASLLYSQSATSGAIIGTIKDPTGAIVQGATLTLVETATNQSQTTTTDAGGRFFFPSVAPGQYSLTIAAKGFRKTTVNQLTIEVSKTATVDQVLELGAASEVVEVQASSMNELQTQDSSVGEVLSGTELNRMPVLGRSAAQLIFLQPAVEPDVMSGDTTGGQIAGARSEQVTFTVDGGDATSDLEGSNNYNSPDRESSAVSPVVPVPQDSVDEFRVTTNNANSNSGNSSGGQVAFVTKSGTNTIHGALYEYHDDDGLNANGWTNDFLGIAKPATVDNRFGVSLGGPIIKDKLFYYGFYEGRRFHDAQILNRVVPTASLKSGILQFQDASGNTDSYNLNLANGALASDCGASGTAACDPRGIGVSSVVLAQLALYPTGNNETLGDGLNSTGFTADYPTPISTNVSKLKLNYNFSNKWSAFATWQYSSTSRTGTEQYSILGTPHSVAGDPYFANFYTLQLQGQVTPNFLSVTHGSFLKNWWGWSRVAPSALVTGTDAALQFAGEGLGNSTSATKIIGDPININTQQARARVWDGHDWYIAQDFTLIHHSHEFQFGGSGRIWHDYHLRTDDILGGLTSAPIYYLGTFLDSNNSYANVGANWEPPACSATVTTMCIQVANGANLTWDSAYASILGMVDHSAQVVTNNGVFQPNPLGTPLFDQATIPMFDGYFQDRWNLRPNFSVTAGVRWDAAPAPSEANGKEDVLTYAATGEPINYQQFLAERSQMLGSGQPFNPSFALTPVGSIAGPLHNKMRITDWNDFSPRVSAAWTIRSNNRIFGNNQTVIRGGYQLVFDRTSAVSEALSSLLAGGLADVDQCAGPTFMGASGGTAVCTGGGTDPTSAFRIGTDGASVPIPTPTALPVPWAPGAPFGLIVSAGLDPYKVPAHTHQIDMTLQRALHHGMIIEAGYIGHFGRNLPQGQSLNAPYYLAKDAVSGQTYAQAFDAVATQLRNGAATGSVTTQPFFENMMGGTPYCTTNFGTTCTVALANNVGGSMIAGDLESTSEFGLNLLAPTPMDNLQIYEFAGVTDKGYSTYHAGFFKFQKAMSHGLQFQSDYTWSHAIGNGGTNQQYLVSDNSPYNINIDKASETFDHRQVFHLFGYYELPFGAGKSLATGNNLVDKWIIGGWHTAGIFGAYTGGPECVLADGDYGSFFNETCAIPSTALSNSLSVHGGVQGSNGIGTLGAPANGGAALNAFANPAAVFATLSHPLMSVDNRVPFDQLHAWPYWNLDFSLGKNFAVTERVKVIFTADAFNIFNHVIFAQPDFDLGAPSAFGVIGSQFNSARQMQLGARVEF